MPSESTSAEPEKEKFSIFTSLQYATTGGATLFGLRSFNQFLTHAQRGRTICASIGCLYLSFANEMGWLPFNFFVKERISLRKPEVESTQN